MLELEEHYHSGLRRVFSEGKRQPRREVLNDFMAAAISYSAAQKARTEEHERWRLERQEQKRRNIEQQQQIGMQMRELIDWATRYPDSMRKASTAGEIDKALADAELFKALADRCS